MPFCIVVLLFLKVEDHYSGAYSTYPVEMRLKLKKWHQQLQHY
jgi:hypothetical protein